MSSTVRNFQAGIGLFRGMLGWHASYNYICGSIKASTPVIAQRPQLAFYSRKAPFLYWYQLYDSETGKPYKGTSADAISLTPGSLIVQFRDAVKVKWDHPGYLKDLPAGSLLVYKNLAAFDQRNSGEKTVQVKSYLR